LQGGGKIGIRVENINEEKGNQANVGSKEVE
jgi:hypothetical protein